MINDMTHRNPRRIVLADLHQIKKWTGTIASRWSVRKTIYLPPAERKAAGAASPWRARRDDEYPENDPREWELLAQYMRAVASHAADVERYARARQRALTKLTDSPEG